MKHLILSLLAVGSTIVSTQSHAAATLKCTLEERQFEVTNLYLTQFDTDSSILYTAPNDADGAGRFKVDVQGDIEAIEYSNECDNLFRLEFNASELARVRLQLLQGADVEVSLRGSVNFWMYAEEQAAVTTSVTCTVDPEFKRVFPLGNVNR
jgi:hypothetical protein